MPRAPSNLGTLMVFAHTEGMCALKLGWFEPKWPIYKTGSNSGKFHSKRPYHFLLQDFFCKKYPKFLISYPLPCNIGVPLRAMSPLGLSPLSRNTKSRSASVGEAVKVLHKQQNLTEWILRRVVGCSLRRNRRKRGRFPFTLSAVAARLPAQVIYVHPQQGTPTRRLKGPASASELVEASSRASAVTCRWKETCAVEYFPFLQNAWASIFFTTCEDKYPQQKIECIRK